MWFLFRHDFFHDYHVHIRRSTDRQICKHLLKNVHFCSFLVKLTFSWTDSNSKFFAAHFTTNYMLKFGKKIVCFYINEGLDAFTLIRALMRGSKNR